MMSWRLGTMAEVMAEFYDGPHATPKPADAGGVYLGIKNLTDSGHLDLSQIRFIAEHDIPKWTKRVTPREGDIVFSYEATLHRYAVIPSGFHGTLGRRLALIRVAEDVMRRDFLLYTFLSPQWRRVIESRMNIGSTVDRIPLTEFPDYPIAIPPVESQDAIVYVLRGFDDLIKTNRRRIEILEEMARLLYREWFVHFRFPGHEDVELVDSELGPIPEGWEVARFSGLVTECKKSVAGDEIPPGSALVGLEHLPRRSTTLTEWDVAENVGSRRKVFASGDIIFGKIRPYFHKVVDAPMEGYSSTDAIVFRPSRYPERALSVASSDEFVATAVATSNGTKMPRANTDLLLDYAIPEPPPLIAAEFEKRVAPASALRRNLSQQNRVLWEARDRLLPRLVSGELDVSELDLDGVLA